MNGNPLLDRLAGPLLDERCARAVGEMIHAATLHADRDYRIWCSRAVCEDCPGSLSIISSLAERVARQGPFREPQQEQLLARVRRGGRWRAVPVIIEARGAGGDSISVRMVGEG